MLECTPEVRELLLRKEIDELHKDLQNPDNFMQNKKSKEATKFVKDKEDDSDGGRISNE